MSYSIRVNAPFDIEHIETSFAGQFEGHALAVTLNTGDCVYGRCRGISLDTSGEATVVGLLVTAAWSDEPSDIPLRSIDEIEIVA